MKFLSLPLLGASLACAGLQTPVLLVHGLATDGGSWGGRPSSSAVSIPVVWKEKKCGFSLTGGDCFAYKYATCPVGYTVDGSQCVSQEYKGGVSGYKSNSLAVALREKYTLSPYSLSDNGLYFYNSHIQFSPSLKLLAPFAALGPNCVEITSGAGTGQQCQQTKQLYDQLEDALDAHYYPQDWRENPNAKIIVVGHSQGGLLIRDLYKSFNKSGVHDNSLANPVNHISQIVTVGTPHQGSPWAKKNPDMETMQDVKSAAELASAFFKELRPFFESQVELQLAPGSDYIDSLNDAPYPSNTYSGEPVPMTVLYSTAVGAAPIIEAMVREEQRKTCGGFSVVNSVEGNPEAVFIRDPAEEVKPLTKKSSLWDYVALIPGVGPLIWVGGPEAVEAGCDVAFNRSVDYIRQLGRNWEDISDLVVDVESQRLGTRYPGSPITRTQMVQPFPVAHMRIAQGIPGQQEQTQILLDIIEAAQESPLTPIMANYALN